jgi:lipoprotein-anchoring transpeptidase ErfK/SrfK
VAVRRTEDPEDVEAPLGDEWLDAPASGHPDAWDEWDELGILPASDKMAEWPEDGVRRARRPGRALLGIVGLMLVGTVVLGVSLGSLVPGRGGSHTPSSRQGAQPATPRTITLFSPDDSDQTRRDPYGTLSTPLPSGALSPPTSYLPPDKPSAYEIGLIAAIGTPEKVIVVSTYSQTVHVYLNGEYIAGSYAITGRPGLPTPTGVWHIFYKLSPATLYSPWPPGSPYWYPPTPVQYTMEFKDGGFLIHDAPWHHVWGPGMNGWHYDPVAKEWQWGSHGCVNAPTPFVAWLYAWSPLGTTVIVY